MITVEQKSDGIFEVRFTGIDLRAIQHAAHKAGMVVAAVVQILFEHLFYVRDV